MPLRINRTFIRINTGCWLAFFYQAFHEDKLRVRLCLLGGLLIVVLQLTPIVGNFGMGAVCYQQTTRAGSPIITAMEAYKRDFGDYPEELGTLVPGYLQEIPSPSCSWLSGTSTRSEVGFSLQQCSEDVTLLTLYSVMGHPSSASISLLAIGRPSDSSMELAATFADLSDLSSL